MTKLAKFDVNQIPSAGRRELMKYALGGGMLAAFGPRWGRTAQSASAPMVTIEKFSALGISEGTAKMPRLEKSTEEWRSQLSPAAFRVARESGTEAPFSGEYERNHAAGLYRCVCCETALFDAKTKFESGTGWPSFYQRISPHNVVESSDSSLFMQRTAVSCRLCDAHLGHVFQDGPQPTGLRYCMNSVSLKFVPHA